MRTFIITKWIEPYKLLESIKEKYQYKDFTFDGVTKNMQKKKFLKELGNSKYSVGLYMKNVNKYYLFTRKESFDIESDLIKLFQFSNNDYITDCDISKPFELVDLGQAEAGILIP